MKVYIVVDRYDLISGVFDNLDDAQLFSDSFANSKVIEKNINQDRNIRRVKKIRQYQKNGYDLFRISVSISGFMDGVEIAPLYCMDLVKDYKETDGIGVFAAWCNGVDEARALAYEIKEFALDKIRKEKEGAEYQKYLELKQRFEAVK